MENDTITKKVEFYFKRRLQVHLTKKSRQFYNGLIIEYSKNHLILDDKVVGETYIEISEIFNLEPYKARGEF